MQIFYRKKPFCRIIFIAAILTFFTLQTGAAQNLSNAENTMLLSKNATISVITMWPGKEIYIAFGHNAVRVKDPQYNIDIIYNYGSFDFEDPLFVPKFVYGKLYYYLSVSPYLWYIQYDSKVQNRIWYEQELNLSREQASAVYAFLENNALEENKHYMYDFIKDNCATRIPDALIQSLGKDVSFTVSDGKNVDKTFRHLLDEFVSGRPLYQFLFYLVLGKSTDRLATAKEATFLPQYLLSYLEGGQILRNGEWVPLISSAKVLFNPDPLNSYDTPAWNPAYILWPLFFITALVTIHGLIFRRKKPVTVMGRWYDFSLFFAVGLIGCIAFYLEFFSVHTAVKENLNILWMWPTHLVFSFFLVRKKMTAVTRYYFLAAAAACAIPLAAWPFWPQDMIAAMIPLMLTLALRAFRRFFKNDATEARASA